MAVQWFSSLTAITSVFSVLAAVFSGWCAWLSYTLSRRLRAETKSDEQLVLSKLIHPGLGTPDHDKCVLTCTLFNRSHRKVYVKRVTAYDRKNNPIPIRWSKSINPYGNPEKPCELIGIAHAEELYLRENMGKEIDFCRLEVFHSFSETPVVAVFDEYEEWTGQPSLGGDSENRAADGTAPGAPQG